MSISIGWEEAVCHVSATSAVQVARHLCTFSLAVVAIAGGSLAAQAAPPGNGSPQAPSALSATRPRFPELAQAGTKKNAAPKGEKSKPATPSPDLAKKKGKGKPQGQATSKNPEMAKKGESSGSFGDDSEKETAEWGNDDAGHTGIHVSSWAVDVLRPSVPSMVLFAAGMAYDAKTGKLLGSFKLPDVQNTGIAISPDGKHLAVTKGHKNSETVVELYEWDQEQPVATVQPDKGESVRWEFMHFVSPTRFVACIRAKKNRLLTWDL